MRKLYTTLYIALCLTVLCNLPGCTAVELCPEAEHPHVAAIITEFNWVGYDKDGCDKDGNKVIPDKVNIVASRILNTWRAHGIADTQNNTVENGMSAPIITDTPAAETRTDESGSTEAPASVPFRLKGGEYNVFATNAHEGLSIDSLHCYLTHSQANVDTLYLHLAERKRDEVPALHGLNLPDFNPTFRYIENIGRRLFYGINQHVNIQTGQTETLHFDMHPVNQEVTIKFRIRKADSRDRDNLPGGENAQSREDLSSKIKIEQVVAEISGVCGRINISSAYLDTTNLYRMAFPFDMTKAEPVEGDLLTTSFSNTVYTLGIIPSTSAGLNVGKGIVQIAVKASILKKDVTASTEDDEDTGEEEEKNRLSRFFYVAKNPRQTLLDAKMIEHREDGKAYLRHREEPVVIELTEPIIIDVDKLVNYQDEDTWEEQGKDDNIDIEM